MCALVMSPVPVLLFPPALGLTALNGNPAEIFCGAQLLVWTPWVPAEPTPPPNISNIHFFSYFQTTAVSLLSTS